MSVRRFTIFTAAMTFLLLLVGGLVHATGSSLACPDWPLCFGQVFPEMTGGVLVEHSHRLLASTIGICTIALTLLTWKMPSLRKWAIGGLVLVIFQGVLGGVTVLLRLPLMVSTAHLATAMAFFSLLIYVAFRSDKVAIDLLPGVDVPKLRRWTAISAAMVYVQLILGALVRHTGSGLACGMDPILCMGSVLPVSGPAAVQMLHRGFGWLTAIFVLVACWNAIQALPPGSLWRLLAKVIPVLLLVQIALGVASVITSLGVITVTAHLGGGALLLAATFSLHLAARFAVPLESARGRAMSSRLRSSETPLDQLGSPA